MYCMSTYFLPRIHWICVGQLCANISELCLEILHTYASDSCMLYFLNYTIAQNFLLLDYSIKYIPHKILSLGDDIKKWASMLQLVFFLQFRSLMRLFSGWNLWANVIFHSTYIEFLVDGDRSVCEQAYPYKKLLNFAPWKATSLASISKVYKLKGAEQILIEIIESQL